ncbi:MAG: 1-acyl-sn-glycerol-3-phosphate acyltransferase [Sedimentisphaerales bacterium]|nr:1-acyl-sn-glycerol-3-phosphate acyltransferase [Sedimentisphaerales bacterium]
MFLRTLQRFWYIFGLWMCRMFCVVFFRMHLQGQENVPRKGPFLLICNHQSYLDPIFCGAPLRRQLVYIGRDSLFRNWLFRSIIVSVGAIPIRRDTADLSAVKQMIAKLKMGLGLCLFPEATRTTDGKIKPMRPGFAMLSRKADAPVVPVVIDGAYECWPKGRKMFLPLKHITVSYGKPINPEQVARMGDDKLAAYLTDVTREMLNQCRIRRGKNPYTYNDNSERLKTSE